MGLNKRNWWKRYARDFDYVLLLMLMVISCIAMVEIYSVTANNQSLAGTFKHEVLWQVMSYGALIFMTCLDYRLFRHRIQWIGYGMSLFLLVAVFAFHAHNGAHSWIQLGSFQLQPSEFVKIFIILAISDYMAKQREREQRFGWKQFVILLLLTMVPFALVDKEPALGQALVILSILGTLLLIFLPARILVWSLSVVAVLLGSFLIASDVFPNQTISAISHLPMKDYQKSRIEVFINPNLDPSNKGFQVEQASMAVGAGEVFGMGVLKGTQTQSGWVPFQQTDFIFSAIAEELGFVGSSVLIFCFFVMLYRMSRIASKSGDDFGTFFIYGVMGMFIFQIFENIGMNLRITPSTGITLPFVSYGGSSLLTNFVLMGIVFSIAVRRRKLVF